MLNGNPSQSPSQVSPKVSSEGFATAGELTRQFNLPSDSVSELLNESHVKLEDRLTRHENPNGKVSSQGFASAAELSAAYNLPTEAVAEFLNESHIKLEDLTQRQEAALVEYAQHFISHQQFLMEMLPHVERYEKMEQLMLNPQQLGNYYGQLVQLEMRNAQARSGVIPQGNPQPMRSIQQQHAALPPAAMPTGTQGNQNTFSNLRPDQRYQLLDQLESRKVLGRDR